jgi:hemoglobin
VDLTEDQVYGRVGEEAFVRLVRTFYAQVPADDILGPMYPPEDLAAAEARLCDFLIGRFGGPPRYVEQRGHPRLRMRHAPFAVTPKAKEHWLKHFRAGLDEVQLTPEQDAQFWDYVTHAAQFMVNTFEEV